MELESKAPETAPRKVLSVGQCGMDHGSISRFLKGTFGAEVEGVDGLAEAVDRVARQQYHLILVNRLLDSDGTDGLRVIAAIRQQSQGNPPPMMLVSNYADAQARAEEAGALPGFGKSSLQSPATIERLRPHLG